MRIFISYAHVDWQFVQNLARRLDRYHTIWYDDRLHAGTDWWQTILTELGQCDCFLFVLSPESLKSKYCLDEFAEARRLDKAILPVRMQMNITLPGDLANVQYADFATRVFEDALADLIGDLGVMERSIERQQSPKKSVEPEPPPQPRGLDEVITFKEAVDARNEERYEDAVRLLNTLQEESPEFLPDQVASLLADSSALLEGQARFKEYMRRYQQIELLALDKVTLDDARAMWAELKEEFEDIEDDPKGFAERLASFDTDAYIAAKRLARQTANEMFEFFDWIIVDEIEGYTPQTDTGGIGTYDIDFFEMSRFPITYGQFRVFVEAEDGYWNDEWWAGLAHRDPTPAEQNNRSDRDVPRDNVNWYEAVAFCRWLSSRLSGYEVRLPTEWEWQWAAQGPEGWIYPWGNDYADIANMAVPGLRVIGRLFGGSTTRPVYTNMELNVSPAGICDMVGNVWEWCLNEYAKPGRTDIGGSADRVARGGSYLSDHTNARTDTRGAYPPTTRNHSVGFRVVGFFTP